jgi:hypothetical protein
VSIAQDIIRSSDAPAVAVLQAVRKLVGDEFLAWEPESLWLELKHLGVDPPVESRARLMAAVALHLVPSFYWDFNITTKTAIALDGYEVLPDILEEPTPAQLAWAFEEAAWIRKLLDDEMLVPEDEVRAGTAVILDRAGFVIAPEQLSFADEPLARRLGSTELVSDVRQQWPEIRRKLPDVEIKETPAGVQLARLAAVELHTRERRTMAQRALDALGA